MALRILIMLAIAIWIAASVLFVVTWIVLRRWRRIDKKIATTRESLHKRVRH